MINDYDSDNKKIARYIHDINKKEPVFAYKSDGTRVPLRGQRFSKLKYIAGNWRVQDDFPYITEIIGGKSFVVGKKLPGVDNVLFDFYEAYPINESNYGKHKSACPEYTVAKYVTDRGVFCAYGKTKEEAYKFLGYKLYREFQDIIHTTVNTQKQK